MGKGRDKRRRKARNKDQQVKGAPIRPIAEPSSDPPVLGDPDAPVPVPLKPKPHLRSGAVAIPEPEAEDELVVVSTRTASH